MKLIIKWGGTIGGIMVGLLLIEYLLYPTTDPTRFDVSEKFGYAAIIASLAVMYLAMLELEKTATQRSAPTLWQYIVTGTGSALVAGAIFGAYNVFYTEVLNPEFMDAYYDHYIAQLPVQSGPEYEKMIADLESQKEMFQAPLTQFLVMGLTVVMIGIPMSVILGLVRKLRR